MSFIKSDGKKFTLRLDGIREDATDAQINSLMDFIVQKDMYSIGGASLSSKEKASIVTLQEKEVALS